MLPKKLASFSSTPGGFNYSDFTMVDATKNMTSRWWFQTFHFHPYLEFFFKWVDSTTNQKNMTSWKGKMFVVWWFSYTPASESDKRGRDVFGGNWEIPLD